MTPLFVTYEKNTFFVEYSYLCQAQVNKKKYRNQLNSSTQNNNLPHFNQT